MNGLGEQQLNFVSIEGLLAYGESLARCPRVEGIESPFIPLSPLDRTGQARTAKEKLRDLVIRAQSGFPDPVQHGQAADPAVVGKGRRAGALEWCAF